MRELFNRFQFWQALFSLEDSTEPINLGSLAHQFDLQKDEVERALGVLKVVERVDFEDFSIEGKISPMEWLLFQHLTQSLRIDGEDDLVELLKSRLKKCGPSYDGLMETLDYLGGANPCPNLYPSPSPSNPSSESDFIEGIEEGIENKKVLTLELEEGEIEILPHRVVYIGGVLCVVGEDLMDWCLIHRPIFQINGQVERNLSYCRIHFSQQDVDSYLKKIRRETDDSVRLVLKLDDLSQVNFGELRYHYLESLFVSFNENHNTIWSATVSPCKELSDWLVSKESEIKVLSPEDFHFLCKRSK